MENRLSSTANSFSGKCNLFIDEKISIINFKDRRLMLNEHNELVFKCRHKSRFKLSWLEATKTPTIDKNRDIDFGWFLLEIITFISGVTNIIWWGWGIYAEKEILGTLDINSKLEFLISGLVNSIRSFLGLIKGTWWLPKVFF